MSTTDTQTELKASFDISHLDYGLLMLLSQIPERVERMTTLADTFGVESFSITLTQHSYNPSRLSSATFKPFSVLLP